MPTIKSKIARKSKISVRTLESEGALGFKAAVSLLNRATMDIKDAVAAISDRERELTTEIESRTAELQGEIEGLRDAYDKEISANSQTIDGLKAKVESGKESIADLKSKMERSEDRWLDEKRDLSAKHADDMRLAEERRREEVSRAEQKARESAEKRYQKSKESWEAKLAKLQSESDGYKSEWERLRDKLHQVGVAINEPLPSGRKTTA